MFLNAFEMFRAMVRVVLAAVALWLLRPTAFARGREPSMSLENRQLLGRVQAREETAVKQLLEHPEQLTRVKDDRLRKSTRSTASEGKYLKMIRTFR